MRRDQRTALEGYGNALAGRGAAINTRDRGPRAVPDLARAGDADAVRRRAPSSATSSASRAGPRGRSRRWRTPTPTCSGTWRTTFEALCAPRAEPARHASSGCARHARGGHPAASRCSARSCATRASWPCSSSRWRRRSSARCPSWPTRSTWARRCSTKAPPFYERTERRVPRRWTTWRRTPTRCSRCATCDRTLEVAAPLRRVTWRPYQTVCNYWIYYWTGICEHVSEHGARRHGAAHQPQVGQPHPGQPRCSTPRRDRPVDVPDGRGPARRPRRRTATPLQALHGGAYGPAIDAQGNADCRSASAATSTGPMQPGSRYAPRRGRRAARGLGPVRPAGAAGGTYKARELGIDNLEDVPVRFSDIPRGAAERGMRPVQGGRARAGRDRAASPTSRFTKQNPFASPYELARGVRLAPTASRSARPCGSRA